jgi:hypothetical protein
MTFDQEEKTNQRTNFVANLKFDTKLYGFMPLFMKNPDRFWKPVRAHTGLFKVKNTEPHAQGTIMRF